MIIDFGQTKEKKLGRLSYGLELKSFENPPKNVLIIQKVYLHPVFKNAYDILKLLTLICFCTSNIKNRSLFSSLIANRQLRCKEDCPRLDRESGKGVDWKWGRRERERERTSSQLKDPTIEPLVCACHVTHFPPFTDLKAAVCIVMSKQPGTNNIEGGDWWLSPEGGGHQAIKCERN